MSVPDQLRARKGETVAPAMVTHFVCTNESRSNEAHAHRIAGGVFLLKVARCGRTAERAPVSACLERPDAVPLPSTQNGTFEAPSLLCPRHLPDIVHDDAVAYVKNGIAIIQMRKSLVCREGFTRRAPIGGGGAAMPSGADVQRVTPSIVGVKRYAMAGLLA